MCKTRFLQQHIVLLLLPVLLPLHMCRFWCSACWLFTSVLTMTKKNMVKSQIKNAFHLACLVPNPLLTMCSMFLLWLQVELWGVNISRCRAPSGGGRQVAGWTATSGTVWAPSSSRSMSTMCTNNRPSTSRRCATKLGRGSNSSWWSWNQDHWWLTLVCSTTGVKH